MKIGIANASRIAVDAIERALQQIHNIQIVWVAGDGESAVTLAVESKVDLIIMETLLPGIGGVEATKRIVKRCSTPILIVSSSVENNINYVFEAMGWGALDAAETPLRSGEKGQKQANKLAEKVTLIAKMLGIDTNPPEPRRSSSIPDFVPSLKTNLPLIVLGASTGGPRALATVLKNVHQRYDGAIVVIQHMEPRFARRFATWLDSQTKIRVKAAEAGENIEAGTAYVAADRDHLVMSEGGRLFYTEDKQNIPYRPSVDVFFDSVARFWSNPGIAVVLTGMGDDGAAGLINLRRRGWETIAQDEQTSTIYGMPRIAAEKGGARRVWSIDRIAEFIAERTTRGIKR